jgi:hypothetical protein
LKWRWLGKKSLVAQKSKSYFFCESFLFNSEFNTKRAKLNFNRVRKIGLFTLKDVSAANKSGNIMFLFPLIQTAQPSPAEGRKPSAEADVAGITKIVLLPTKSTEFV